MTGAGEITSLSPGKMATRSLARTPSDPNRRQPRAKPDSGRPRGARCNAWGICVAHCTLALSIATPAKGRVWGQLFLAST
eukprot:3718757-Alexandrium_andersonii.AAC.1